MLGLISNQLQASLIESGKLSLKLQKENILSIIEDCIFHNTLFSKEFGVGIQFESHISPRVRIDIAYMQDVIIQLMENALLNAARGTDLTISIIQNDEFVQLGMDFLSDNSNWDEQSLVSKENHLGGFNRSFKSSLPLIRKIIELHKGKLWISNYNFNGKVQYRIELPKYKSTS